jgi:hypothetical protein
VTALERVAAQVDMPAHQLRTILVNRGYIDAADGLWSEQALSDLVVRYLFPERAARTAPPAAPAPAPRRRMDPALAHRMVEEGAARHRARILAERVVREVIAERLRTPTLSETCPECSATQRCWEHER